MNFLKESDQIYDDSWYFVVDDRPESITMDIHIIFKQYFSNTFLTKILKIGKFGNLGGWEIFEVLSLKNRLFKGFSGVFDNKIQA